MQMTGNTILITGGGSGIGRGLADAFQARGNTVIIAGRRKTMLDEVTTANPGMKSIVLDIASPEAIKSFAADMQRDVPTLNAVIHNAGIMRPERIQSGTLEDSEAMLMTNLLGPIRLTAALLPLLQVQSKATLMTVSSGLAFVPLSMTPTYCATKAAIHSYTQSLRYQLKDTAVQVLELIPPYVQTELMGSRQANDPRAMPLDAFITEVMSILETQPDSTEICVDNVKPLRFAEANGEYPTVFTTLNDAMAGH